MIPPMFLGSKVNEDPQEILDEVYKIFNAIGVSSNEKVELATYQLNYVAQTLYTEWKDNRVFKVGPVSWEVFRKAFLDRLFSRDKREAKVEEFIKFR